MKAKYSDICPECEYPILTGDDIERREYDVGWVHVTCPKRPKPKVCRTCFMEIALSGEHDCEDER